jgi:hypothetical protein
MRYWFNPRSLMKRLAGNTTSKLGGPVAVGLLLNLNSYWVGEPLLAKVEMVNSTDLEEARVVASFT